MSWPKREGLSSDVLEEVKASRMMRVQWTGRPYIVISGEERNQFPLPCFSVPHQYPEAFAGLELPEGTSLAGIFDGVLLLMRYDTDVAEVSDIAAIC